MRDPFQTLAATMDRFQSESDMDRRWDIARDVAAHLGCTALNVGAARADTLEVTFMRSAMRESWLTEYVEEQFMTVDPFVQMVRQNAGQALYLCRSEAQEADVTGVQRDLFARLDEENYRMAFGARFDSDRRGEGRMVTLFSDLADRRHWTPDRRRELELAALVFNAYLFQPDGAARLVRRRPVLSGRERDVLLLLASGLQNLRIAERLGVAEVTVRAHFASARAKLGARTREQALAIAMRDNHIAF